MEEVRKKKRWISLTLLTLFFVIIAVGWFCLWFFHWRFYIDTDDAYVHGNLTSVSAVVTAPVTHVYFKESDFVHEGDLLLELSSDAAEAQLQSASGALAAAVRRYFELKEQAEAAREALKIKEKQLHFAQYTFFHKSNLEGSGILPGIDIEGAQTQYEIALSELTIARAQYQALWSQIEGTTVDTHPLVQEAKGHVISAYLNLKNTKIYAPQSGYIGLRAIQPGEWTAPGKVLFNILPLSDVWVEANYKENLIHKMGIGQRVILTSDLYGDDLKFEGTVLGISPGTGAVFSFLPPQNATGNWIKVIQRVPVIIGLDEKELKEHPLLVGISMHAKVHVDNKAPLLTTISTPSKLSTSIYDEDSAEAHALVEKIIHQNSFYARKLVTLLTNGRFPCLH